MLKTIGDVCQLLNGYSFKSEKYVDSGIRIIRIANVQKGFIEDNSPAFYPLETPGIENYMLKEGDLLISLTGNVGRVALLNKEMLPAALNQRVACLRIKDDSIYKKFLFHYLNSSKFENTCILESRGVAQKNMSTEWLKRQPIPNYILQNQIKISKILDSIIEIINKKRQQLQEYDQLIKSRFVEMFGDVLVNDRSWIMYKWNDVLVIKNGKNQKKVENKTGKYPICGSGGVMSYADDYICNENSVIIGRKGNINNPILMREKYWNVDTAFGLEPHINRINVDYLYMFCTFYDFLKHNKTVTIPSLTKTDLLKIDIPIPPVRLQNEFSNFVHQVDKLKFVVQKSLDETQKLFDSLMQEYFG